MKAPWFWYRPAGLKAFLLSPLAAIYSAGTRRRLAKGARHRLGVPVICVGNINAGGTGKSPTVAALAEKLIAKGRNPQIISKGYGGSLDGPVKVNLRDHTADEVGDEPLMLSAFAPVWVAKDRLVAARAAIHDGADVMILDDGFQDPTLAYSLSIVVVDAVRGFGNEKVIPAGPLREPVRKGLARADALLCVGQKKIRANFTSRYADKIGPKVLEAELGPLNTGMDWVGARLIAFAGIGDPDRFFQSLSELGAELVGTLALDDHQPLTSTILKRLTSEAQIKGAQLVTTEKDAVRLPANLRSQILTLPVRLRFEDDRLLDDLLDDAISSRQAHHQESS